MEQTKSTRTQPYICFKFYTRDVDGLVAVSLYLLEQVHDPRPYLQLHARVLPLP